MLLVSDIAVFVLKRDVKLWPTNLRHVATLPREIKNSNFLLMWTKTQTNCILIASNFVIHPQILIFSAFTIASLSPYSFQIKLSISLFFTCYRQHCTQRSTPVFKLLRGLFWGFSPRRGDMLHRWGEIWHEGPLLRAKFHLHRCKDKGIRPPKLKFTEIWSKCGI